LDQGETGLFPRCARYASSPELARLFTEVSRLQSGEDVWFNLDPKGMSDLTRLDSEYKSDNDAPSSSASGWR